MASVDRVDVLIVTALREELQVVLAHGAALGGAWVRALDRGGSPYHLGEIAAVSGQRLRVAAAWLGEVGQAAATMRSRALLDELDPSCLSSCGVCAGYRGRVHLGDVIVADDVYAIDAIDLGEDPVSPAPSPLHHRLPPSWKMGAAEVAEDLSWALDLLPRRPISYAEQERWTLHAFHAYAEDGRVRPVEHPYRRERCPDWAQVTRILRERGYLEISGEDLQITAQGRQIVIDERLTFPDGHPPDPPFRVHLGAIAATSQIVKDRVVFERLRRYAQRTIGLDMESAAIASVASHANRDWLVVKGVVDHADGEWDVDHRAFACEASARYLFELLLRRLTVGARDPAPAAAPEEHAEPLVLQQIRIQGFKNISELELDFTLPSKLEGRWTCLAGINGSGKTAILQAIVLALLGDRISQQLAERLGRMVRRAGGGAEGARITLTVRSGAEIYDLSLPLSAEGIDAQQLAADPNAKQMREVWERRARREILVAYGASRNLSEFLDNRHESLHPELQRQMTLFDPLARVARAEILRADAAPEKDARLAAVIGTLRRLLQTVLAGLSIQLAPEEAALRFTSDGVLLPVTALPDGFRSTIAWLADLCAAWHEKARAEDIGDGDPARIRAVVLVDEIDLHLHPSLQRELVPRLRKALPLLQWVVTTHSPLVLASFDRHEIKVLDSARTGGVRQLDRDILGFSMDQIYSFLMETPPQGAVMEELLHRAAEEPERRGETALLLAQAPDFSKGEAEKRLAWRKRLAERIKREGAEERLAEERLAEERFSGDEEPSE